MLTAPSGPRSRCRPSSPSRKIDLAALVACAGRRPGRPPRARARRARRRPRCAQAGVQSPRRSCIGRIIARDGGDRQERHRTRTSRTRPRAAWTGGSARRRCCPPGSSSRRVGARVLLKAENLQLTGLVQGARRAQRARRAVAGASCAAGVVAASAGNHAQAVAWAARDAGRRAPRWSCRPARRWPRWRRCASTAGRCGWSRAATTTRAPRRSGSPSEEGRTFVHAFDDADVVAGQGTRRPRDRPARRPTCASWSCRSAAAGCRAAWRSPSSRLPDVRVVGVQAEAARRTDSLGRTGRSARAGEHDLRRHRRQAARASCTLPLVERYVDEVVTVSDDEVAEAMVLLLERSKLVVEGAGAVGVAALLHGQVEPPREGDGLRGAVGRQRRRVAARRSASAWARRPRAAGWCSAR